MPKTAVPPTAVTIRIALIAVALRRYRPLWLVGPALAVAAAWSLTPIWSSFAQARSDPEAAYSYWRPALSFLNARSSPSYRVEVVDTAEHYYYSWRAPAKGGPQLTALPAVGLGGRANGYVLDLDPETVDLFQFRRLRRQADALIASGENDHAALLLREADGLWRGQALAGIRGDWVARMRGGLEEERRAAILERVGCELALGKHAALVGELHGLLAQYPLDETFLAHQMTALYRAGRPGDALSLFRETRDRLVEDNRRQNLLSDAGYRILRFTASDVYTRPDAVVAEVRRAVSGAAAVAARRPAGAPR